ncbi:MAG: peptidoglycan DD-metalloendopeptidase family protein [Eubacteriales bacterium]|nr:peptidoglycan DD-metalloendopeptidase family protein [Eubacteriales bacterium]
MKEKMNQMFKDKLFLVMLVLGLLTIVAAAGVATMRNGGGQEQNPYVDMQGQGDFLAENQLPTAGPSNEPEPAPPVIREQLAENNQDTVIAEEIYGAADNRTKIPETPEEAKAVDSGLDAAASLVLNFSDSSKMLWPVRGNVVLDYNMESTIYFPTLDQYKCNPGLVIQGEISDPVYAPANARVLEAGTNEEIGNYLVLDLGNDYSVVCGQLKEVAAVAGEYLEKGQLMGYVAEPTKYYTIEGSNIFLEMKHRDAPVDPLDYLE